MDELERFRILLDHSSEIILLSDPADFGRIVDANQFAVETLGYSREELLSLRVSDIEIAFPVSTKEDWETHVHHLKSLSRPLILEGRQRKKDGTSFPVEVSATVVSYSGKEYTLGVGRDITTRKQAESRVIENELYYRKLIEHSSTAIILIDMQGKFLYQSPVVTSLVGYELDGNSGSNVFQFVHPAQLDAFKNDFEDLLKHPGLTKGGEYKFLHRNGGYVWIEGTLTNLLHDPPVNAIIGTYRVTEDRKNAERRLENQRTQLSIFFEYAPDAIAILNSEAVVTNWNSKAEKIFGWKREEIIGKSINDCILPESALKNFIDPLVSVAGEQLRRSTLEMIAVKKDNSTLPIRVDISDTVIEGSRYFICFIDDITELKEQEARLIDAMVKANSANHAKSQFLANMSHEIRTPMNAILGFSELLHNKLQDERLRHYVSHIRTAGKNLILLIDDILDLSKIEAGKTDMIPVVFNLREFVYEVANMFSLFKEVKHVPLAVSILEDVPDRVVLDPIRLRQILYNLLGNAFKFTERGMVSLTVARKQPQQLSFIVKDTGIGIASDQFEAIFEVFSQQDAESTRKYGGTGLGLAITKRLVELMAGTISVSSELKKGSSFEVIIPFVSTEDPMLSEMI